MDASGWTGSKNWKLPRSGWWLGYGWWGWAGVVSGGVVLFAGQGVASPSDWWRAELPGTKPSLSPVLIISHLRWPSLAVILNRDLPRKHGTSAQRSLQTAPKPPAQGEPRVSTGRAQGEHRANTGWAWPVVEKNTGKISTFFKGGFHANTKH